jgi:hypothetical protein
LCVGHSETSHEVSSEDFQWRTVLIHVNTDCFIPVFLAESKFEASLLFILRTFDSDSYLNDLSFGVYYFTLGDIIHIYVQFLLKLVLMVSNICVSSIRSEFFSILIQPVRLSICNGYRSFISVFYQKWDLFHWIVFIFPVLLNHDSSGVLYYCNKIFWYLVYAGFIMYLINSTILVLRTSIF